MIKESEFWLLIIGAIISLISTITGFTIQLLAQKFINQSGKIKIYKKLVYSKVNQQPWGFSGTNGEINFSVPLWIEIHNTKNQNELIRNLNLVLYNNKKKVGIMRQISHFEANGRVQPFANNGSYSFLIGPHSIEKYDLQFMMKKSELKNDFNEVKLRYYDTKDKLQKVPLLKIKKAWFTEKNTIDNDWILIK